MERILQFLKRHEACKDGYVYSRKFREPKEWWDSFDRGDWMLWVIGETDVRDSDAGLRKLTLCKVEIARTVQHSMKDKRSLDALDIAEKFGNGLASFAELQAAYADAAAAAADYAAADYAAADYANAAAFAAASAAADASDAFAAYAAADYAAADYAAADAANAAAFAAADAADAFAAASVADASDAAFAADAYAAAVADAAYADAAKTNNLKRTACIVRKHYSIDDVIKLIEEAE